MLRTKRNKILNEYDSAGGIDIPKVHTFDATSGQKVRVAISWASHPDTNNPPASDDLMADLNLVVTAPSGAMSLS